MATNNLPTPEESKAATTAYLRGLPTIGQQLNQEMSFASAPPGSIGHGGYIQPPPPVAGSLPSAAYTAAPIQTPIAAAPPQQHAVNKAGVEAAWNALDAHYRAQDSGAPAEAATPVTASLPSFPDTIAGRIARQGNALEQRQAREQAGIGIKQQEANTQAANVYSESALRAIQGRTLGSGHLAEITKSRLMDEYLHPDTDETRRERIAHILGVIKPDNMEAEKDVMGQFTGRVLNKATGEMKGGPAKATPAEGSRHQDANGNIAVWQNGKYVPVSK